MRAAIVVKFDAEVGEVAFVRLLHLGNERFLAHTSLPSADHHGGAVRVVGTKVPAVIAEKLLKTHPDVRLDVLHQVPNMNGPVRIGQGGSNKDSTQGNCLKLSSSSKR